MSIQAIVYPILAQVALTIALFAVLAQRKSKALRLGEVNEARRALHEDAWPDYVLQVNNCIRNQFEIPILFYVVCLIYITLDAIGLLPVIMACGFVLSRFIHAYIHVTNNHVPTRRRLFSFGVVMVLAMLIWLLIIL